MPLTARIGVEAADELEQFGFAGVLGQGVIERAHAAGGGHFLLAADIDLAGRIVADQHHREPGHDAAITRQTMHGIGDLAAQFGRDHLAVNDLCGHVPSPVATRSNAAASVSSIARDHQAFDPRRGAGNDAHMAGRDFKGIRNQPHERVIRFAFTRGRAHARLEHKLSIGKVLNPVDRIAAALGGQANHNNDPARNHGPRSRRRHVGQNTFG